MTEENNTQGSEQIPSFIKNRIDVKVESIISARIIIDGLVKEKLLGENNKVIIITNIGIVEGDILLTEDENNLLQQISTFSAKARNNYFYELEKNINNPIVTNNSCYLNVYNAKLTPFSNPANASSFGVLHLFSDQIVGFTYGEHQPR